MFGLFLSTPSARRATSIFREHPPEHDISIHALREEGDAARGRRRLVDGRFLSTPSARRATRSCPSSARANSTFLSTPSARRATQQRAHAAGTAQHFYPRPPRGGRHLRLACWISCEIISIHALREEGDVGIHGVFSTSPIFLSTPSARRATGIATDAATLTLISIHALREEGDSATAAGRSAATAFLSTPSARRATAKTERKHSAFVSLYTSLHKLQRGVCESNRKITPLLAQTAVILVRSVQENHVRFLFALAVHHPDIKRSAHYPAQTPGAVQRARP